MGTPDLTAAWEGMLHPAGNTGHRGWAVWVAFLGGPAVRAANGSWRATCLGVSGCLTVRGSCWVPGSTRVREEGNEGRMGHGA